jgi:hypothetical protein
MPGGPNLTRRALTRAQRHRAAAEITVGTTSLSVESKHRSQASQRLVAAYGGSLILTPAAVGRPAVDRLVDVSSTSSPKGAE